MYKFNGGSGAIICNLCRVIIKEPAKLPLGPNQFHICNKCKPDWYNKLYMEDVNHIVIEAMKGIKKGFKDFDIDIEAYQKIEDEICDNISDSIEKFTQSEYRSHL